MNKQTARDRKRKKIRTKVKGTGERPRLSVFKSNQAIYTQLIDDVKASTLASAKGKDPVKVGTDVAKQALAKKIKAVVFDRGGYAYTGKIRTVADAARKAGLKF